MKRIILALLILLIPAHAISQTPEVKYNRNYFPGPVAIGTTGGSATLTLNGVAVGSASGTTNFETGVSTIGVTAWGSPGSAKAGN
ncbi:MAG: hypothetical protein ABIK28_25690, partial [Planctomycetota bacterium]